MNGRLLNVGVQTETKGFLEIALLPIPVMAPAACPEFLNRASLAARAAVICLLDFFPIARVKLNQANLNIRRYL